MTHKKYKTHDDRRVQVAQSFNDKFGTFIVEGHTLSLKRYKSASLPMRDTSAAAQADLDTYAEKMKWTPITQENTDE